MAATSSLGRDVPVSVTSEPLLDDEFFGMMKVRDGGLKRAEGA
jgi:hypothetical protein